MNRRFKVFAGLALIAMLVPMLVSCAAPATPEVVEKVVEVEVPVVQTQVVEVEKETIVETKATRGGDIVFAMNMEPDTLDPHVSSSRYDVHVEMNVYDTLLCFDSEAVEYKLGLAESYEVSDDGLSATIKLKEGVTFHDGEPFNAEAVKINIDRILNPDTKSEAAVYYLGPLEGVEVVDEYTVKFTWSQPYGDMLYGLANGTRMISPKAIEEYGQELYQNMVGTGPFKFVEWEQRDHVTLVRNDDYNWASECAQHNGPAYLESVTYKFIEEANTRLATLKTGEANIANRPAEDTWNTWAGDPDFKTAKTPQGGLGGVLDLNTQKFPTDDLKVRQALSYLIDRQEVILGAYAGIYQEQKSVLSPYTVFYASESELYNYDPDKGLALLEEAGWTINDATGKLEKDGQPMVLEYLTLPGVQNVAVVVQGLLAEYGIDVNIIAEDNPAQQSDAQKGIHNIVWIGWAGTEPNLLKQLYGCENVGSGWNFSHYCSEEVQSLLEQAVGEVDNAERERLYREAQVKIMEDAAVIPLNVAERLWVMQPNVMNLTVFAGEQALFYDMYILQE